VGEKITCAGGSFSKSFSSRLMRLSAMLLCMYAVCCVACSRLRSWLWQALECRKVGEQGDNVDRLWDTAAQKVLQLLKSREKGGGRQKRGGELRIPGGAGAEQQRREEHVINSIGRPWHF